MQSLTITTKNVVTKAIYCLDMYVMKKNIYICFPLALRFRILIFNTKLKCYFIRNDKKNIHK